MRPSTCPLSASAPAHRARAPRSIRGKTATEFLEWVTPSSLKALPAYSSTLSVLLNADGGIIDDLIITKHAPDAYYVVTNAGRRAEDLAWFGGALQEWANTRVARQSGGLVNMEILDGWGLLALQGACYRGSSVGGVC